jgi:hypothetical protein
VELVEGEAGNVHWRPNLLLLPTMARVGKRLIGGVEEIFLNVFCRGGVTLVRP